MPDACWQRGLQQLLDGRRATGPNIEETPVNVTLVDTHEIKAALALQTPSGLRDATSKIEVLLKAAAPYARNVNAEALLQAVLGRIIAQQACPPTRLGSGTTAV